MTGQPDVTAIGIGAVAVGGSNFGTISAHVGYAGRPPVSWPHRVGVVPPVAAGYLPRTDPAVDLERVFGTTSGTAVLTGVVSGMGGVGKTQLAAAHAHRAWDAGGVDLLVWLTAASRDAIVTGYAQAGADVAHPPEGEDTEQVAARFLAWLASTDKRWLVVLDDLADPADLKGLWPQGKAGRVLVTTRRRDNTLADRGTVIGVDLFTSKEAADFLAGRLDPDGRHSDRLAEAGELAEDLGRLPLALAQAAAYMRDRELACADYRRRLARRRLELALPPDAAAGDYAGTVAGTWSLSVELADRLPPAGLARPLLTLTALLDPHGIPTAVFATDAVRAYLAAPEDAGTSSPAGLPPPGLLCDEEPASSAADEELLDEDVGDVLSSLHRLNLLTLTRDQETAEDSWVRVHPLVQRATREQAAPAVTETAARVAADALLQAWPQQDYQPEQALLAQSLRNNTDALAATAPGPLWTPDAHLVLFRAGRSRTDGGLLALAVPYWAILSSTAEQRLGPDHPSTLGGRGNLALAYRAAGRLAEALPLFERTLADAEQSLGPDHPVTLIGRGNLALAYRAAGRPAEAVPLLEQTLADRERILGPDHRDTLTSRNNLALAYRDAGRLTAAVPQFERTLADAERLLGPDHPDTLIGRDNLAVAYRAAGRLTDAVSLFERILADRERILGPDHPVTLIGRNNLALAYRDAGRLAAAVPQFERTLTDAERVLGSDHPNTLTSRSNLAAAYQAVGRLEQALPLLERTLAERERLLGPDHPDTLASRNNLAGVYYDAGRLEQALPLLERTLADTERLLGADHPATLTSRNNLASAYQAAGRLAEAVALLERTATDAQRILGTDHPDTLTSRDNLAFAYQATGRLAEARALYERLVADTERVLGPVHPHISGRLLRLGRAKVAIGDLTSAAAAFGRVVEVDTAAYGPNHPEVATDLDALASVQEQQGNAEAAAATRARAQRIRDLHQSSPPAAG